MVTTANRRKVTCSTMPGPWSKSAGLGGKVEVQKVRESPDSPKLALPGEYEAGDITLTRLYDAARDADLVAQLNTGNFAPFGNATITEVAFDAAALPVGRPIVSSGCTVASWELSDSDANDDGKPSELTVVWSVGSR